MLAAVVASGCSHRPGGASVQGGPSGQRPSGPETKGSVQFSIRAPGAGHVVLVLMGVGAPVPVAWEVRPHERENGFWTADLDLMPGEYRYFFLVDGSVTVGDGQGRMEMDDFGGKTGVLTISRAQDGSLEIF